MLADALKVNKSLQNLRSVVGFFIVYPVQQKNDQNINFEAT